MRDILDEADDLKTRLKEEGRWPPLWCLHVQGPDDMHPAPSKEAAEKVAARLQLWWDNHGDKSENDPVIKFVATLWPHSPESHAKGLKDWHEVAGRDEQDVEIQRQVALWDAINRYVVTCGGDPSHNTVSVERMRAVADVNQAVRLCQSEENSP